MSHLTMVCSVILLAFSILIISRPAEAGIFGGSDCGNNRTHNFYFGVKSFYDKLFYINHTYREYSFFRKISVDVTLPPPGQPPKGMITYIEVLDLFSDGNGGCAYIRNGGVGQKNVTLHLKSERNQGLDFIINVYGH